MMDLFMMENFSKEKFKEMVYLNGAMEPHTLDNGVKVLCMAMVNLNGLIIKYMLVIVHLILLGDFKNDMKDGHGKITYTDGSSYEG